MFCSGFHNTLVFMGRKPEKITERILNNKLFNGILGMNNSYIMGTLSTLSVCLIYCVSRFQKSKKAILTLDLIAKILTIMMFFFFSAKTGIFSEMIGLSVLIIANIRVREGKKCKQLYYIYMLIYTGVLILTFDGLSSLLCTAVAMISVTSNWWFDPQKMRIADIIICALMFVLDMSIGNYAGFTELIIMTCNIVSFKKYSNKSQPGRYFSSVVIRQYMNFVKRKVGSELKNFRIRNT